MLRAASVPRFGFGKRSQVHRVVGVAHAYSVIVLLCLQIRSYLAQRRNPPSKVTFLDELLVFVTSWFGLRMSFRKAKRRFLRLMQPGSEIFKDALEMAKGRAELDDGCLKAVPVFEILVAGFPCTAASTLNPHSRSVANRTCVASGTLSTGSVFHALLEIMTVARTDVAILENVPKLATAAPGQQFSNLDEVARLLRERCDMVLKCWLLDPRDFGGPQQRRRLWMVAVRRPVLRVLSLSDTAALAKLSCLMNRLVGSRATALEHVLLPESHPVLRAKHGTLLASQLLEQSDHRGATIAMGGHLTQARPEAKRPRDSAWPERHRLLYVARGEARESVHSFDASLVHAFPGLLEIGRRQRELLDLAGVKDFPTAVSGCIETSQSAGRQRLHIDFCPTITPHGRQYLSRRCRVMHSWESLRFQGLYLHESLLERFSENLLQDLAGNAFETGCCLAAMVVTLALLSSGAASPPNAGALTPVNVSAAEVPQSESDSDSHCSSMWCRNEAACQL